MCGGSGLIPRDPGGMSGVKETALSLRLATTMTLPTKSSYAAGHFELQIDGHKSTAFVKSVDGGWARANVTDDPVGPDPERVKQISSVDIDPISLEFGLAG